MDKTILCLANSYKHGGRCIAGIEIELNNGVPAIKRSTYGIPIWIRPVSHSAAGEVPLSDAAGIDVLSVIRIHDVQYAGSGAHSEDYYYNRMEKIASINPSDTFLRNYTDTWHPNIFGNRGRAVTPDSFASGNYSLMLIRTEGATVYLDDRFTPKPRIKFAHNGNEYDFPITDPDYLTRLRANPALYHENYGVLYIVASLGVEHEGWHSKLAATIITPATINVVEQINIQSPRQASARPSVVRPTTQSGINNTNSSRNNIPSAPKIQRPLDVHTSSSSPLTHRQTESPRVIRPISNSSYSSNPTNRYSSHSQSNSSSSSGGCYIATSVYGSYDCPEVWTLRRFRDFTLAETWYGRTFIHTYYAISPTLVKLFGNTRWFNTICKEPLDNLVHLLQTKGFENTPYQDRNW